LPFAAARALLNHLRMKNIASTLLVASAILALRPSAAEAAKKETPCEAQRIVEMRNAVLAAQLLCKETITIEDYNAFILKNRKRIFEANKVAVRWHMKTYGSRARFDKLDSQVMNRISSVSAQNPPYFCSRMETLKPMLKSMRIDELLAKQTQLEVPICN
jgi:hypothetical protein